MPKVNRDEFLSRLQSVRPGLSPRDVVEQSSCFVFDGGKVCTFNDEVCCKAPSGLGDDFAGAVAAKPLLALLEKLAEDEVEVEAGEGELLIRGLRREAGVRMEAEVSSDYSAVTDPDEWRPLPADWDEAVGIVASCAGRDDSRFSLTCVHLTPKYIEACDNFQLTRYRLKTGLRGEALVRRDALKAAVGLGVTHVGETDSWVHFKSPALVVACRRYVDEDFPDLGNLLDVEGTALTLPGGLAEAVEKAQIFSEDNPDDDKVEVELRPGKLRIHGRGASGWFRESKKLVYSGPPMQFLISPKLLVELTKRTNSCEVAPERLKVDGDKYRYVTCLAKAQDEEEKARAKAAAEDEVQEVGGRLEKAGAGTAGKAGRGRKARAAADEADGDDGANEE